DGFQRGRGFGEENRSRSEKRFKIRLMRRHVRDDPVCERPFGSGIMKYAWYVHALPSLSSEIFATDQLRFRFRGVSFFNLSKMSVPLKKPSSLKIVEETIFPTFSIIFICLLIGMSSSLPHPVRFIFL